MSCPPEVWKSQVVFSEMILAGLIDMVSLELVSVYEQCVRPRAIMRSPAGKEKGGRVYSSFPRVLPKPPLVSMDRRDTVSRLCRLVAGES